MHFFPISGVLWALLLLAYSNATLRADLTEQYAVLVSATLQDSPPTITLHWEQDPDINASPSYTIYRKGKNDASWGIGTLLGNVLTYTDTNVAIGEAYEYQVTKTTALGHVGYGYLFTGIRVPAVPEDQGKLILVVDETFATSLAPELARLERDLVGDGWTVIRHDVVRDDESIPADDLENLGFGSATNQANAAGIRNLIIADYNADPANVKAVLLFGRVPIFRCGDNDPDGHLARPMPADGFYGEMDGTWDLATNVLPTDVELMVGRIDLSRMPGKAAWNGPPTFPSELELLRQYLNKDHNFRHRTFEVERRAIVGEGFGALGGRAFGASGWRNFTAFFGADKITRATLNTSPGSWQEIVCDTAGTGATFLWAEGNGSGQAAGMGALGTHGQYYDVWTRDLVGFAENGSPRPDIKAVFTHLYGSWFGEWDRTDDLLRGVLASRTMGLTSSWSGSPHHYYHHMGLGETVGYGMRLSQNNDGMLYRNQVQEFPRAVHIALMGDPTLRLHPVRPVTDLTASVSAPGTIDLNWVASGDSALQGYNVYRSASPNGPFVRLNPPPVTATTFADTPSAGTHTYMVRAVKLESGSGTYLNLSQGVFVTASTTESGAGNGAPSVSAGPDRTVLFRSPATLSGTVGDDGQPGPVVIARWHKASGPGNVYFADLNAPATQARFSLPGAYTLRLTGNDGALIATDDVNVTVEATSSNQPPIVDAGTDQSVILPGPASLTGSVNDDGVPNLVPSNTWTFVSGPGNVAFSNATAPGTTATFSATGIYVLRLIADDGALTGSDDVVLTVNPPTVAPPGGGAEFSPDAHTVALYHFNGDYADASGNGYDLTAAGGVTRSGSNLGWMLVPAGETARFASLGDELSVTLPDSAIMDSPTSAISIEAKIFVRDLITDYTTPNATIVTLVQDYDSEITIRDSKYHSPAGPEVFGSLQTVAVTSATWNAAVTANAWHDLLITLDSSDTLSVFLDGSQIGTSVTAQTNRNRTGDWSLTLGNIDGDIDELRISSVVRAPIPPAVSFASWMANFFSPAELQDAQLTGPEADPDSDEIPNVLEFALSLDPLTESEDGLALTQETVGADIYAALRYTRPSNAVDIVYEPEVSSDLQEWSADTVEVTRVLNEDLTETVTVRDTVPSSGSSRRFIRLRVYLSIPDED